jgi:hypothetical protein
VKQIKKLFVAYQLDNAIEDVTRVQIEHSEYQFTLSLLGGKPFETIEEAEKFISDTMKDYDKRNVGDKTRFVILSTYVFEGDENFKTS